MISKSQLQGCLPEITADNLEAYYEPLNEAIEKYEINTNKRLACFLAQIAQESKQLNTTVENLNYSAKRLTEVFHRYFRTIEEATPYAHQPEKIANRVYANRYGNRGPESGDGWKYRGRGFIQCTFPDNYGPCGKALGLDLINHPELLEKPLGAAMSAGWYWKSRGCNELADTMDFKGITKKINPALEGYEKRLAFLERNKTVLGI